MRDPVKVLQVQLEKGSSGVRHQRQARELSGRGPRWPWNGVGAGWAGSEKAIAFLSDLTYPQQDLRGVSWDGTNG